VRPLCVEAIAIARVNSVARVPELFARHAAEISRLSERRRQIGNFYGNGGRETNYMKKTFSIAYEIPLFTYVSPRLGISTAATFFGVAKSKGRALAHTPRLSGHCKERSEYAIKIKAPRCVLRVDFKQEPTPSMIASPNLRPSLAGEAAAPPG
jgi:hypothetical protein